MVLCLNIFSINPKKVMLDSINHFLISCVFIISKFIKILIESVNLFLVFYDWLTFKSYIWLHKSSSYLMFFHHIIIYYNIYWKCQFVFSFFYDWLTFKAIFDSINHLLISCVFIISKFITICIEKCQFVFSFFMID